VALHTDLSGLPLHSSGSAPVQRSVHSLLEGSQTGSLAPH
jgi:hypothetical protein